MLLLLRQSEQRERYYGEVDTELPSWASALDLEGSSNTGAVGFGNIDLFLDIAISALGASGIVGKGSVSIPLADLVGSGTISAPLGWNIGKVSSTLPTFGFKAKANVFNPTYGTVNTSLPLMKMRGKGTSGSFLKSNCVLPTLPTIEGIGKVQLQGGVDTLGIIESTLPLISLKALGISGTVGISNTRAALIKLRGFAKHDGNIIDLPLRFKRRA